MIHTTVGVYNNDSQKTNGVKSEDLAGHIWYNLNLRPGRAFFVDGYCLNKGYLDDERIEKLKEELKLIKVDKCTAPYV